MNGGTELSSFSAFGSVLFLFSEKNAENIDTFILTYIGT